MGRVVVVSTSPRIPPGLLSWPAWQALRSGPVCTADPAHRQLAFLAEAGVEVEVLARPDGGDDALADLLAGRAEGTASVVWLAAGESDAGLVHALGLRAAHGSDAPGGLSLEVVPGSYDPPGARLLDVVAVMDRLRSPGGCPWDAAQTHETLMPYLLEEAYEAYGALEDNDRAGLREELGDVLLQVAFHARLAQEGEPAWSIDDVAGDLVDKLVRRHPHVFAGASAEDAAEVERNWAAIKAAEKGRTSVTDGVPLGQPALSLAARLQRRGGRLGVPVPAYEGAGGELWALVARCREQGVDPEAALRAVARAYRDRLAELEAQVRAEGGDPADLTPEEWARRWA